MIFLKRKNRKNGIKVKHIIIISSIIVLNFIGIGYGYWNDGLQIRSTIATGRLEAMITNTEVIISENYQETVFNNIQDVSIVSTAEEVDASISYTIKNIGSISMKVDGHVIKPDEEITINTQYPLSTGNNSIYLPVHINQWNYNY